MATVETPQKIARFAIGLRTALVEVDNALSRSAADDLLKQVHPPLLQAYTAIREAIEALDPEVTDVEEETEVEEVTEVARLRLGE